VVSGDIILRDALGAFPGAAQGIRPSLLPCELPLALLRVWRDPGAGRQRAAQHTWERSGAGLGETLDAAPRAGLAQGRTSDAKPASILRGGGQ
jgi:hypothetical protein